MIFVCDVVLLFLRSLCLTFLCPVMNYHQYQKSSQKRVKVQKTRRPLRLGRRHFLSVTLELRQRRRASDRKALFVFQSFFYWIPLGNLRFDRMYVSFKTSDQMRSFSNQIVLKRKKILDHVYLGDLLYEKQCVVTVTCQNSNS